MLPQPPASTLFPYTTLFRSGRKAVVHPEAGLIPVDAPPLANEVIPEGIAVRQIGERDRSEEHTSELQSHHDIVCRLLLEKKNLLSASGGAGSEIHSWLWPTH